jgi:trehalose utilization protein
MTAIRVTVRIENRHEQVHPEVQALYPDGMHAPIAKHLRENGMIVCVATFDQPEHGLTDEMLAETDMLSWWGHMLHKEVADGVVDRVQRRVLDGMGWSFCTPVKNRRCSNG